MRFSFRGMATVLAGAALIFFGSCDKHHLGELPEVQKEHVDIGSEAQTEDTEAAPKESASPTPLTTATPADFFPESTPQ